MKKHRKARPNATGRNDSERYLTIGYPMAHSLAWRTLSGPAAKLWVELRSRFNGGNNGRLRVSLEEAASLLRVGKATAARAFGELEQRGFLAMTKRGQWYGRQATEWAMTTLPRDGVPATNAWKRWVPTERDALGSSADRKNATRFPSGPKIAADGSASAPMHSDTVRLSTRQAATEAILRSAPEPLVSTMGSNAPVEPARLGAPRAALQIALPATFAVDLKRMRSAAQLSQRDLAEWSGLSQPFIANIERDRYRPSAENWARLALALDSAQGALAA